MAKLSKKQRIAIICLLSAVIALLLIYLFIPTKVTVKYMDLSGTKNIELSTHSSTVGAALENANNIDVSDKDLVKPTLESRIKKGMTITVMKGTEKEAEIGGKTAMLVLYPLSVEENLKKNDISFDQDDIVKPSLETIADEYTNIVLIERIVKEEEQVKKVAAKNKVVFDPTMDDGKVEKTEGKDGEAVYKVSVITENGVNKGEEKKFVKWNKKPVDGTVKLGTKSSGEKGEAKVKQNFVGSCAAYYYTTGGRGTDGSALRYGTCAVDTKNIKLGSKLYIEGYGFAVANNRGANLTGKQIDVYAHSKQECMNWGVKNCTVYVLK